ncbi:MAG TPA: FHA domain-containing protein [Gammaproteobacteria bacterium]|nr:FHA domain-containing protein [Gammaproteobacteria bacterium]
MHLQSFGLTEQPFEPAPPERFIFLGAHQAAILTAIRQRLMGHDRLGIVTGESGVGKTTLLGRFVAELGDDMLIAAIRTPDLDESALLQSVLNSFGFDPVEASPNELHNIIRVFAAHSRSRNRDAVLVVEDAQVMSAQALECICRLAALEQDGEHLLNVLLAGPPELNRVADSPGMGALAGRHRIHLQVPALDTSETRGYIDHRLAAAGAAEPERLFPAEVSAAIHEFSAGVPRRIDSLGAAALEAAFEQRTSRITVSAVETAVRRLALDAAAAAPERTATRRSCRPASAHLVVSVDGDTLGEYPLAGDRIIAGRHEQCDIQLEGRFISRHHAMLVRTRGGYCLVDLNSTNGTFVNSGRVVQRVLSDGDVVEIGSHRLEFRALEAAASLQSPIDCTRTEVFESATTVVPAVDYALARARIKSVR